MAAVAAASAELLIIGWYIFRVLLQRGPFSVRPRPAGNKESGRGGRQPPTNAEALSNQHGVQVLPAEGGVHRVEDRAARAGRAPPSPQLRPQPLARGHVTRCSCASRPAWEPMPPRNRGSPVLPRQRSICQGQ
ncbi:neuronatin isoform X1 [Pipistrellus kuhlii]|uniref:Neuronatin n=1 Tax=Pipistrellus kuhlii TaxID=59472 RepID=A0A7J7YB54_PIPKU|nr:neuronatin isoform X1 [Pipistrellus kuhlii]KAF6358710.1 neuronatin [Pipistrellus kuhlii]